MNFFESQDRSRRATRRLVVLFIVASVLIVAAVTFVVAFLASHGTNTLGIAQGLSPQWAVSNLGLLGSTAGVTTAFIGLASTYRVARLSSGGSRVALDMGGTLVSADVTDPLRRRLRNVVEEMSIASGVPVPEIYVLESEPGINAFAAGFNTGDAAVAVTRGTLELLNRDELQGVIAHEFSHILNGDMRLNIRLMGILFGILAIGVIGRLLLRGGTRSRGYSGGRDSGNGVGVIVVIGLALFIIGSIGIFMGRLIKAGVSREREYLADASAVQFTRQTDGIAGALKKIGGYNMGSRIRVADAEEVSHMLFALGTKKFTSLLATHPPLADRIRALDPSFKESDYSDPALAPGMPRSAQQSSVTSGFAEGGSAPVIELDAAEIKRSIGNPSNEHIVFAGRLRRSIPELLYNAAHSHDQALLLALALVLDDDDHHRTEQLQFLETQLGSLRTKRITDLHDEARHLGRFYRLPLLDLAFPVLKKRPPGQLQFLLDLVDRLVAMDSHISLFEYCISRVLRGHLREAAFPQREARRGIRLATKEANKALRSVLETVALHGTDTPQHAERALSAGLAAANLDSSDREFLLHSNWMDELDKSLDQLQHARSAIRERALNGLIACIEHDDQTTVEEAELLRAICANINCPLPPMIAVQRTES